MLWLWPGQAIYTGPALDLEAHSGSVACLAIGLDDVFTVRTRGQPAQTARSALIAPRLTHRLVAHGDRMLFCYLDPGSSRRLACERQMTSGDSGLRLGHREERLLIRHAPWPGSVPSAPDWLDLAAPREPAQIDARIQEAAARLRTEVHRTVSAEELAIGCGLSTSRFLHLFPAHTGTTFRRYRLWTRMLRVAELLAGRHDLTTAATDAGFASPSHFSEAFHRMFGLRPSRLLAAGVTIIDATTM
ncbi:AraC-like DNA-binding protein [Streptosporangium album]|uniref:AraC-like DNA-binding protein n=1 Tax=Streptosporangium album TaxID=47479 RepID=A0A7W7RVY5_9ACTN|nr:AraC family transcriptional regulator [Streptosporangium album]MBB4939231.1 AraC-like DNA-binding protein [Streptosporangium album]